MSIFMQSVLHYAVATPKQAKTISRPANMPLSFQLAGFVSYVVNFSSLEYAFIPNTVHHSKKFDNNK